MNSKRILVGMSGGIDSTWTAKKLLRDSWDVEGAVLIMHDNSPVIEARRAAESLGIVLHEVDCREAFFEKVERPLVEEYANCRTPNPCVLCNAEIKFHFLAECARGLGIDKISTGHYVKVEKDTERGRAVLRMAQDKSKDQSYFLWRVEQEDLLMFHSTLDEDVKTAVRENLEREGIVHDAKESQEICFIPDDDRAGYIMSHMSESEREKAFKKGEFLTLDGRCVGEHQGLANYTLGQRKGLGIALGRPAYVLKLDAENNRVVVGFEEDNRTESFSVSSVRFVSTEPFEGEVECFVRVRHRGTLLPCSVRVGADRRARVSLKTADKMVSSGQSAVFYDGDGRVLFGGFID